MQFFKIFILSFIHANRNLKRLFFIFLYSRYLFSTLTLSSSKKTPLHFFQLHPQKNIHVQWRKQKLTFKFFNQIDVSNISFLLFSYFRDLFLSLTLINLNNSLLSTICCIKTEIFYYDTSKHFFKKKNIYIFLLTHIEIFRRQFFNFFHSSQTFLQT